MHHNEDEPSAPSPPGHVIVYTQDISGYREPSTKKRTCCRLTILILIVFLFLSFIYSRSTTIADQQLSFTAQPSGSLSAIGLPVSIPQWLLQDLSIGVNMAKEVFTMTFSTGGLICIDNMLYVELPLLGCQAAPSNCSALTSPFIVPEDAEGSRTRTVDGIKCDLLSHGDESWCLESQGSSKGKRLMQYCVNNVCISFEKHKSPMRALKLSCRSVKSMSTRNGVISLDL
ncbi:hypothetical protein RCL1_008522 [Eukaryota sp. TZLM3-RCL]